MPGTVHIRVELEPRWPLRLPPPGADGVMRVHGGVLERLLHVEEGPVLVRAAQGTSRSVLIGAWARTRGACEVALERMRFALGLDDDLAPFHARFREDPLIGALVRRAPVAPPAAPAGALRGARVGDLRAADRVLASRGHRAADRPPPRPRRTRRPRCATCRAPRTLAGTAPALLESFDLSPGRALALRRAAREVASGRVDLRDPDHERGWRRLRALPGIGAWTVECLALHGQGRFDQVPAGDLALRKLVGRLRTGDPQARAQEQEVRELFAPYAPWGGLAATYAMRLRGATLPVPAGTRP